MDDEEGNATDNSGEGDKQKRPELIELADKAAERLEKANAERKELIERDEKIIAEQKLGGRSEGGFQGVKKEETSKEYADKVMGNAQ